MRLAPGLAMLVAACGARSPLDGASRASQPPDASDLVVCHPGDPQALLAHLGPSLDDGVEALVTDGKWLYGVWSYRLWALPASGGTPHALADAPVRLLAAQGSGVLFDDVGVEWISPQGGGRHTILAENAAFVDPPNAFVIGYQPYSATAQRLSFEDPSNEATETLGPADVIPGRALTDRYLEVLVSNTPTNTTDWLAYRIDRATWTLHDVVDLGPAEAMQPPDLPPAPNAACFNERCLLDERETPTLIAYDPLYVDDAWAYADSLLGFLRVNLRTLVVQVVLPDTTVAAAIEANGCLYLATESSSGEDIVRIPRPPD